MIQKLSFLHSHWNIPDMGKFWFKHKSITALVHLNSIVNNEKIYL